LIVTGGPALPYAEWIVKVSLPESRNVNCSNALKLSDYVHIEDYRVVHRHGPGGEHSHPLLIPYSWLDPAMAKKQAVFIAKRLKSTYPNRADAIDANLVELTASLNGLVDEIKELDFSTHKVISTSPNLSFIARAVGVENDYLLWIEPAKDEAEEEERQQEIKSRFAADDSIVILAAGAFAEESIKAALGDSEPKVVPIGLLDLAPKNGDYMSETKKMIANLKQILSDSPAKQ
jgi:zinc transport system substrate-binding protein